MNTIDTLKKQLINDAVLSCPHIKLRTYPDDHQAHQIEQLRLKLSFDLYADIELEEIEALTEMVKSSKESINDSF